MWENASLILRGNYTLVICSLFCSGFQFSYYLQYRLPYHVLNLNVKTSVADSWPGMVPVKLCKLGQNILILP